VDLPDPRLHRLRPIAQLAGAGPVYARLRRSQYWPNERIERYAQRKLERVLASAKRIPFYASRLAGRAMDFSSLPVLLRSDVPALNRSVRESRADAPMSVDRSSGSSGMPVEFLFDGAHQRTRFASRFRYLRAHGWNPLQRTAWLVHLNFDSTGSPDDVLAHQRFIRARHSFACPTHFDEQLAWLARLAPENLYTFPSNLDGLLDSMQRGGRVLPSLRRVFTGAEVVDDSLRERARRILGLELHDNYGSTEAFLAWQCAEGSYHVNAEHVLIEIVDPRGRPVGDGEMGKVVVTTLDNRLMPLVRYEIGDYAVAARRACACGRTLPTIARVVGRALNLFRLRDGRLVSPWPFIEPLKAERRLERFQLVQRDIDRFEVRYVAAGQLPPDGQDTIRSALASITGSAAAVEFQRVDELRRSVSGKFMLTLSELPDLPALR